MLNAKAVALKYEQQNQRAPKVVAKGKGEIAAKIMEKAREFQIPIFQNKALVESLIDLEVDQEIPPRLYNAVVEVFVWLQNSEKKAQLSSK